VRRLIVFRDPRIQAGLQLVDRTVHLFAERNTIEFVEHGLVESFTDAVGLRALGLGARVIDVLDREIELVFVPFGIAAILAAAVGQYAQQLTSWPSKNGSTRSFKSDSGSARGIIRAKLAGSRIRTGQSIARAWRALLFSRDPARNDCSAARSRCARP
jgi:hypothetical protein